MELSIIILNYNTKNITKNCIQSIEKFLKKTKYEILLVDNNSTDDSVAEFKKIAKINKKMKLIESKKNLGFVGGNNLALKHAHGHDILLLNSDTLLLSDIASFVRNWSEKHPKAGIMTCKLQNSDGSFQPTGGYFPNLLNVCFWMLFLDDLPILNKLVKQVHPKSYSQKPMQLDWVTGAFFWMKREVYEQIGELSSEYFMYVEDLDYCYRSKKAGWQVWYLPGASITHLGGSSSTSEFPLIMELKNHLKFYKKNYPSWQYQFFVFLFKLGTAMRAILFTILKGKESGQIYAKAFSQI